MHLAVKNWICSQMKCLFSDLVERAKQSAIKLELSCTNSKYRITEFDCISWERGTMKNWRLCNSKDLEDNTVTKCRNETVCI